MEGREGDMYEGRSKRTGEGGRKKTYVQEREGMVRRSCCHVKEERERGKGRDK